MNKQILFYHSDQIPEWLNLGTSYKSFGDINSEVSQRKLAKELKIQEKHLFFLNQQHGTDIIEIISSNRQKNLFLGDGLMTKLSDCVLIVKTADCLPIIIVDKTKKIIMALHAGRMGLQNQIIFKGLDKLTKLGSLKSDLLTIIGPFIEKKCYPSDLWFLVNQQITSFGLESTNVYNQGECTFCLNEKYFSYRRGDKERMGTFVRINN